jgi:hypothetical protein
VIKSQINACSESWASRWLRWRVNWFPCYWMSGGRVVRLSADFKEMWVRLTPSWRTRNYLGTLYGGSLYGCVDPIYMLMLAKLLGPAYVVWDKAADVRFKRPGRTTVYARFVLDDAELAQIKHAVATQGAVDRVYRVDMRDAAGDVYTVIDKTLYIADRTAYQAKLASRNHVD